MMSRKRKIGILLTVCLLTVGLASVYAAGPNPFETLDARFENLVTELAAMWANIGNLQTNMTEIQETLDLYGQIAALEFAVDGLTAKVALLEATTLYGPQGAQGIQGPPGTGTQGEPGEQGIQGIQGIQGDEGIQGDDGNQGIPGIQGLQGEQGPIGPPGFGPLIHDSGWIAIDQAETLVICALEDPTNVFVYMMGKDDVLGIHHFYYGGVQEEHRLGASWHIHSGELKAIRYTLDEWWDEVRLMVWELPPPP